VVILHFFLYQIQIFLRWAIGDKIISITRSLKSLAFIPMNFLSLEVKLSAPFMTTIFFFLESNSISNIILPWKQLGSVMCFLVYILVSQVSVVVHVQW
jgi:hypothetical protein